MTIRLADLAVINDVISDVTFENCVIEGPAVVALLGNTTMSDSGLDGDTESVLWVIPDARQYVIGAIALVDCTIVGCSLRRIGLAIPESQVERVSRGFHQD